MNRQQVVISIATLLLVLALYQLPRFVITNEGDQLELQSHELNISDNDQLTIKSLNNQLSNTDSEIYTNFADSLARIYLKYGIYDSALLLVDQILEKDRSLNALNKVSRLLYQSFIGVSDPEQAEQLADKLQPVLESLIQQEPDNTSHKNKLAMTLVTSANPMAGISLLREILASNPNDRETLINLGLLSIRSSQFDKGLDRFRKVLSNDPNDFEAMLYSGVCLLELDSVQNAEQYFIRIKESAEADPVLKAAADQYLERN